jgi:sulfur-oxidizing protein SoxZ
MTSQTKMKTRHVGGQTEVLVWVRHPMEAGRHRDEKTQKLIRPRYIETMVFRLNGEVVAEAYLGPGLAPNPLTTVGLRATHPGDRVTVSWTDNTGDSDRAETTLT